MSEPKKNELDSLDLAVTDNTTKVNKAIEKINGLLKREKQSGTSSEEKINLLRNAKSDLEKELETYKQRLKAATDSLNESTKLLDEKIETIKLEEDGRRRRSRKSRSKKKRSRRTKRKYRK
jgi:hypothetical protein